jgi:hypothetical protein
MHLPALLAVWGAAAVKAVAALLPLLAIGVKWHAYLWDPWFLVWACSSPPPCSAPARGCRPRHRPQTSPVGYAVDIERVLSAAPGTPIGAVDGVGDRRRDLSVA